ncbi:AAA family ATPase [Paludisphaera sp.]|uniref:AAA family ATPase n=1 Tax=Paludisphaera sp. TaxID=2017432 RepID=UPI00301C85C8
MIKQLVMEGYRGFERYTLANLSRVNLLVGKNNSGKSSILEAVQLLADGGDFRTLDQTARRRGETILPPSDMGRATTARLPDISHFFHGHSIEPGSQFWLYSGDSFGFLGFEIVPISDYRGKLPRSAAGLELLDPADFILVVGAQDGGYSRSPWDDHPAVPVSMAGAFDPRRAFTRHARLAAFPRMEGLPSLFLPPESLDRGELVELWDKIITDGDEGEVVRAMQLLEPDLTSIAFLSGERSAASDPRGGVVVGFQGEPQRRPLGSHGEGMRRLLTLAVVLARTKGGVLLIDEVDTGLHYSILGDVWSLIVETAVRNDVQVFLTTHSLDSLRALAWFCGARPDLAGEVTVQKIERRLDEAVAFEASEIQIAIEQDIEVR